MDAVMRRFFESGDMELDIVKKDIGSSTAQDWVRWFNLIDLELVCGFVLAEREAPFAHDLEHIPIYELDRGAVVGHNTFQLFQNTVDCFVLFERCCDDCSAFPQGFGLDIFQFEFCN